MRINENMRLVMLKKNNDQNKVKEVEIVIIKKRFFKNKEYTEILLDDKNT